MTAESGAVQAAGPASLIVVDPNGQRKRVPVDPVPFLIGRQPENHLILRDSRVSRSHARILVENGVYVLEDLGSRHGTFVNGRRVKRKELENTDRVEFGAQDSYQLLFALDGAELKRLMEQVGGGEQAAATVGVGSNLAKLRAILDLARTLQSSFSIDEVLSSVVDTALTITGAERGFLLLRPGDGAELETRVARNRRGQNLRETDLRVPREVIRRKKTPLAACPDFTRVTRSGFPRLVPTPALSNYVDVEKLPSAPASEEEMRALLRPLGLNYWLGHLSSAGSEDNFEDQTPSTVHV